jgi:hypothetical protein
MDVHYWFFLLHYRRFHVMESLQKIYFSKLSFFQNKCQFLYVFKWKLSLSFRFDIFHSSYEQFKFRIKHLYHRFSSNYHISDMEMHSCNNQSLKKRNRKHSLRCIRIHFRFACRNWRYNLFFWYNYLLNGIRYRAKFLSNCNNSIYIRRHMFLFIKHFYAKKIFFLEKNKKINRL